MSHDLNFHFETTIEIVTRNRYVKSGSYIHVSGKILKPLNFRGKNYRQCSLLDRSPSQGYNGRSMPYGVITIPNMPRIGTGTDIQFVGVK